MKTLPLDPTALVDIVETSLGGSEFGLEAWTVVKKCLQEGRGLTPREAEILDELIDRARDDLEGPSLRVDLSKNRVYG